MKLHRLEIEIDTDSNTYTGSIMVEGERLIEVRLKWDTTFIPAKPENEGA